MRRAAPVLDLASVAAFVAIGRASHHHGETVAGLASTAWPFLAGLGVAWSALAGAGRDLGLGRPVDGAAVTAVTVAVGMALRVGAGQGTAVSFTVVAVCFLGCCQVGGRALLAAGRRHSPAEAAHEPVGDDQVGR